MTSERTIQRYELDDPDRVSTLFRSVLKRERGYEAIVKAFGDHPEAALARLGDSGQLHGLTTKGSADVLNEIIGAIGDDRRSKNLIATHLTTERFRELLSARGDLPSEAAELADLEDLVAVITEEVSATSGDRLLSVGFILRSWAIKLKTRDDYSQFLQMEIDGQPILHWLLGAIWNEARSDKPLPNLPPSASEEEDEEDTDGVELESLEELADQGRDDTWAAITVDAFDAVGIEPSEGRDLLIKLVSSGQITTLDPEELAEARLQVGRRRAEAEQAPSLLEEVREDAAEAAGELEF